MASPRVFRRRRSQPSWVARRAPSRVRSTATAPRRATGRYGPTGWHRRGPGGPGHRSWPNISRAPRGRRAATGAALVASADLTPPRAGLPRRSLDAGLPRDDLHLPVRAGQGWASWAPERASSDPTGAPAAAAAGLSGTTKDQEHGPDPTSTRGGDLPTRSRPLGGRPRRRSPRWLAHRDAGRAPQPLPGTAAPSQRRRHRQRHRGAHPSHASAATDPSSVGDLGSRDRDDAPPGVHSSNGHAGVLLRRLLTLAAARTRTHTVCCGSTCPRGRSVRALRRGPEHDRQRAQQQASTYPQLADSERGLDRERCDDRLKAPSPGGQVSLAVDISDTA